MSRLSSAAHLALCVSQLQDASKWLQRSFEQCQPIDVTKPLTAEQYDALENLSSRFATKIHPAYFTAWLVARYLPSKVAKRF